MTAQGGLIVAVVGALDDDAARATASLRQPGSTGLAFVLDRDAFARASDGAPAARPTGADATTVMLATSGWAALTVGPTTSPDQAWDAATTHGRTALAR